MALALLVNPALEASGATSSSVEEPQIGISDAVVAGEGGGAQGSETEEMDAPDEVDAADDPAAPEAIPAPTEDEAIAGAGAGTVAENPWLHSPEAVRQRQESRTAFDDLSSAQARDVLSAAFAETLVALDGDPARNLSDLQVEEVVGTYGALVADGEGGSQLLESPVPVRDQDPGEATERVDLALEPVDGGYVSDTPSGKVKLPRSPAQELRVDENFGVASLPGRPEVSAERFGDKDLFLPNTDIDTDTFIAPLTAGVEVFEHLRSPRSPQRFRFPLTLPKGAALRPDGIGGAQILDSSEKRLGFIPAPYALDAQGTDVPVSMSVEGNAVVVDIPHRTLDLAYPILLDPEFVTEEMYWNGNHTNGLSAWKWEEIADYDGSNTCMAEGACWTTGLYARSKGNNYWYPPNTYGQWVYTAPNTTAFISRTVFWTLRGSVHNCYTEHPHGYVGIYDVNAGAYDDIARFKPLSFSSSSSDTTWKGDVGTRKAVVGITTGNVASQLACGHDFYVGGATIWQDDRDDPTVTSLTGYPGRWITGSDEFTITANTSDPGLGVRKITFGREGSANSLERPVGCNGTASSRCPESRSQQYTLSGKSFDEGKKTATITVEDATARKGNYSWYTHVDLTKPDVTLTGQLATATKEAGSSEPESTKAEELSLPVYNLKINATDIGTESNPDHRRRSGVAQIEVRLDGVKKQIWQQDQPCSEGSCPMERTYPLKLNSVGAGEHDLEVFVTDNVGLTRERVIEFEYIPATGMKEEYVMHYFPLPDGSGNEAEEENPERPELAVNVMNGNLVYREKDIDVEGHGVDLEVERYYNSLLPEDENTEWGDGWTLAQTPDLAPEPAQGSNAPTEALVVDTSGAVEGSVPLPTSVGEEKFDPQLQAVVTKEPGGYEVADATGEGDTAVSFDAEGQVEELRTEGVARVDYSYEASALAEIDVEDPASSSFSPEEAEVWEEAQDAYAFTAAFGSYGTGPGQFDYAGDIGRTGGGNFWVADPYNHRIQKLSAAGKQLDVVTQAADGSQLMPNGLAVDVHGRVFVTDSDRHLVEVFNAEGTFVRRFGGGWGTAPGQFRHPEGITVDLQGDVWVADMLNGRLQEFAPSGTLKRVVGTEGSGPGQIDGPADVAIASDGTIWAADFEGHDVEVFEEDGDFIRSFGTYGSADGQFAAPVAIALGTKGKVWVADMGNNRVQQFNSEGTFVRSFGSQGSGEGQFQFGWPVGIVPDTEGNLWITDGHNDRVQKWAIPGEEIAQHHGSVGSYGTGPGQFDYAGDVGQTSSGDLWVADPYNHRIQKLDEEGNQLDVIAQAGDGKQLMPNGLAVDAQDNVLITDSDRHLVEVFDPNGNFLRRFGGGWGTAAGQFRHPQGLTIDPQGDVLVTDMLNGRLQEFSATGTFKRVVGTEGSGPGQIQGPADVAVAADGTIWVADFEESDVEVLKADGTFIRSFGTSGSAAGQFASPVAIALGVKDSVWVADMGNGRVQQFDSQGAFVRRFGSTGSDEGQFQFGWPVGIVANAEGDVWVTDGHNDRVQRWRLGRSRPAALQAPSQDDPEVEVDVSGGVVTSVEGEEAGVHAYGHEGDLLTAHIDADGMSKYKYDAAGRMTRVDLPNGTWAEIEYGSTDGRVKKVTVDPAGSEPAKSTTFTYTDQPRSTKVLPPGKPVITYDIGEDGSVVKWRNAVKPPEFESIAGTLYDVEAKETAAPISIGDYNLIVRAYSEEGIASIHVYANGRDLISEKTCPQVHVEPAACKKLTDEWVTYTGDHSPGILHLEMLIEDRLGQVASQRFWVNIPYTPPPAPDAPRRPRFAEVLQFREEHGLDLDLDPVQDELELNDRVYDTINDWVQGNPVALASMERWGAPLRTREVAELEYRLAYWRQASEVIPGWANANAAGTFAGFYLDERTGGKIVVGFTGGQAAASLSALEQTAGLMAGPDRIVPMSAPPAHTLAYLESLRQQVLEAAAGYPSGLVTRTTVEVRSNSVRVGASNVPQAESLLDGGFGQQAPIVVDYQPRKPELKVGRERIGGMVRAGDEFLQNYPEENVVGPCTANFGAFDKAKKPGSGEPVLRLFALTAGHCEELEERVWRRSDPEPTEDEKQDIGFVRRSGYEAPGGPVIDVDAAAIRLENPNFVPRAIFQAEGMPLIDVTSVWSPTMGTNLCLSGRTSKNIIRCGPMLRPPEIYREGSGEELIVCFEEYIWGGDSGSPVWVEGTGVAVGIAVLGYGGPNEPGLTPEEQAVAAEDPEEACATLLIPYPGRNPAASAFGSADMAPLHLVTHSNAQP